MLLPHQEIKALIEKSKVVEGADPTCVGPASYELRIGSYRNGSEVIPLNDGAQAVIPHGGFVLLGSKEKVNFGNYIAGNLILKSSFGRQGLMSWSQGFVDPGYLGHLTIALHNFSGNYFPIYGGQKICHLIFMRLSAPTNLDYAGPYKGSGGAMPADKPGLLNIIGRAIGGPVLQGATAGAVRSVIGTE